MQQVCVSNEDVLLEQTEWNQSLDKKDLEALNIKEEQEDLCVNQEGRQLHVLGEADITMFPFTVVSVKSEDEEKPQSSHLHQSQRDESTEMELSCKLTRDRTLKTEAFEDVCGGSQPDRDSGPCTHFHPHTDDVQTLLVIKEEALNIDQEDIMEEQEKLWVSRQGQQLHQLEEADITKFPLTVVTVKSENDDEKLESTHVHRQSDDSTDATETELVATSSSVHRTLTAQVDGEDRVGPQQSSHSGSNSHLQPDTSGRISDSSETETDDFCDWKQTRDLQADTSGSSDTSETKTDDSYDWKQTRDLSSGFSCLKNMNACVSTSSCSAAKKQHNCSECGKVCACMDFSNQHKGRQESEKSFTCPIQGKRLRQKRSLNRQMRIHTEEKPFGCSECGKSFVQNGTLLRHMKIHTGEKPLGCSECGKRFGQKGDLIKHMRIHTGQKPFVCSECGKRFRQKTNLSTHARTHTGEKPFKCCECGKRFGRKDTLIGHTGIHTGLKPFVCCECGKRFIQKGTLTRHMRIHTGEKPFSCSECGKRFAQNGDLNIHMRIHRGNKKRNSRQMGKKGDCYERGKIC
ncbi:zinc finger protein 260-like isoform X1 [Thalassophryne amazonica]|uniref:zinc finger protein 260-like isoform X1 n=1 Tax=Thalassophryne amazonica TaxID=390379 RepID=UPI0014714C30|nr:zinc finger protein 260-like isoform X1 [Thalassophryne amazonica]XP_034042731.1 zinc finger protein 260-like isoform X1 [Thalassophryne amazonica]